MDNYDMVMHIVIEETGCEELRDNPELDLINNDIIDSLAFINLIDQLSMEFGIEIQPTQVSADTWRTVKKITEMVNDLIANK